MSNISSMIHMLFRYAVFIVIVIILLIIGLMFFYFTNQITYQNNKINTMFGIVTEMVQKDIQPLNIPFKPLSDPTQNIFQIPGSSVNLVEVSDSDDSDDDEDDEDEDDDDTDNDDDDKEQDEIPQIMFTTPVGVNDDNININLLDITDVDYINEESDSKKIDSDNRIKADDKMECDNDRNGETLEDLNITIIHSEPKHNTLSHKSLHVNELRKMAVQLQLIPQGEAKKLKKDELVDLLGKSTEAKQD